MLAQMYTTHLPFIKKKEQELNYYKTKIGKSVFQICQFKFTKTKMLSDDARLHHEHAHEQALQQ